MKRTFAVIVVLFALVSPARGDEVCWSDCGHAFGQAILTELHDKDIKDLDAAPKWDRKAKNPPLSARKAVKLGDGLAEDFLTQPLGWRRELGCLRLLQIGGEKRRVELGLGAKI